MNNSLSIVGSSRKNGERQKNDFYPTPAYVVEELLKRESFNGNIWECACGKKDITKVLKSHGYRVFSSDLVDYGFNDKTIDFLQSNIKCDNIVTNPPYKHALEFVLKAKQLTHNKFAMFLKTVFLESDKRYDMFQDVKFPLKVVYQFSKRVTLYKNGKKLKNSGMIAYAWFVWDKNYNGKPYIEWIR